MQTEAATVCPGCGIVLPGSGLGPSDRYLASGECEALYGELSAYNIERARIDFLHQLAVDAYAAQHAGPGSKAISVAFALIGLCLAVEQGRSGRQVQQAHMELSRRRREWPRFDPPAPSGEMNVGQVLETKAGDERDEAIRQWAAAVWGRWQPQQEDVRKLLRSSYESD